MDFALAILTQSITFLPLALGISISYHLLRATDMTIDGSFVIGAAVFARLVMNGVSPTMAAAVALACGGLAGVLTALIQRGGKVDPLLAGVLATFILNSLNLLIMNKPNINLLTAQTLFSSAFEISDAYGWWLVSVYVFMCVGIIYWLLRSRFGLLLRAFGDNPTLFKRQGKKTETYRLMGFAITNALAATSGCLTAQTIGYADIGMGLGVTLTGIGAIILGQQVLRYLKPSVLFRAGYEIFACFLGVLFYFSVLNALLRLDVNPVYLKMILGLVLIIFLRAAHQFNLRKGR